MTPPDRAAITVLLADDQILVRAGFKLLLDVEDDITVLGETADGAQAVTLARATRPDVVLVDIRMPVLDGIKATQQIAATRGLERVRVLILTHLRHRRLRLRRTASRRQRLPTQRQRPGRTTARHPGDGRRRGAAAPRITRRLIAQFTAARTAHQRTEDRLGVLTQRERDVLALVGQGLNNAEIAVELTLSPATARTHVSHAMIKFRARDRANSSSSPTRPAWSSPSRPPDLPVPNHDHGSAVISRLCGFCV